MPGRVARTGVQQYTAQELGLTDRPPNELVNVYRPPEEVFKPESLASYDNADITLQHPNDFVDSKTFKAVSVGHATTAGRRFGDFVVVDHLIKDQAAIDAINAGTAELSAGYSAEYILQPGVAPCGTPYEFIQTDILVNHIALCDSARAGHLARLFDSNKPKEQKPMPQITLDIDRLKELILKKGEVFRQSDKVPVSENMFDGNTFNYLLLLARGLEENIGPFWNLSSGEEGGGENVQDQIQQ